MAYSPASTNPFGFVVTPWVKRLLIANGVAFLVTLALPGLRQYLVFTPVQAIPNVWTVFTYMFVHIGFWHLLFNMLALFFFGPPLEDRWGSREFLKFYFVAGLGGALLSVVFPTQAIAGASAAVYGVMVAFAMFWPDNPIYFWGIFPIKAKYLVGFLVGLSLFMALSGGQSGVAHLAHLGGAIAAFAYLRSPWAPPAWGAVTRPGRPGSWNPLAALKRRKPKRVEGVAATRAAPRRAPEIHRSLDDVDRILEKISAGGISSLTEEERRRLEEASRRFRSG